MTATSRKEKAAETETALKEAAKRVFAARGYLNTKITDITAEAGRAAGSFYNHFTGKETLLEALLADISASSDSIVEAANHTPDFSDPEAIRWHVRAYWNFYRENAATMQALRQAAMVNEEFDRKLARFGAAEQEDVHGHLTHITEAGLRLPATPQLSIAMMYQLIGGFAQMWLLDPPPDDRDPVSDEEVIDSLTRFVYRGFTGRDY
jgi:AcrR family transcriptional regulator